MQVQLSGTLNPSAPSASARRQRPPKSGAIHFEFLSDPTTEERLRYIGSWLFGRRS